MISHHHKTIFVHIPKAAGQSVEQMYLSDLGLDWSERASLLLRPKTAQEAGPERLAHLTAEQYTALGYIDSEQFEAYFKWTLVRNPYYRALSCYHFLGHARVMSFETFVKKVIPQKINQQHFFYRPQYDYLHGRDGRLLVDYVVHLERLNQELAFAKQKSGIEQQTMPHANKKPGSWKRVLRVWWEDPALILALAFGHHNKDRKAALTPAAIAGINHYYSKDFKAFGYALES